MDTDLIQVERSRFFSAHHMMITVARHALPGATFSAGREHDCMTVIVMAAGAVEALANALLYVLLPNWEELDKLPPLVKLRLCFESLGAPIDRAAEPWTSIKWLAGLRNKIMHGQPEPIDVTHNVKRTEWTPQKEVITRMTGWPRSAIERKLTADNARRAVQTFENLMAEVTKCLPEALSAGILRDSMSMTATPSQPPVGDISEA